MLYQCSIIAVSRIGRLHQHLPCPAFSHVQGTLSCRQRIFDKLAALSNGHAAFQQQLQDAAAANPSAQLPAASLLTESIVQPRQHPAAEEAITSSGEVGEAADSAAQNAAAEPSRESIRPSEPCQSPAAEAVGRDEAEVSSSVQPAEGAYSALQPPAACLPVESIMPSEQSRPSTAEVVGPMRADITAPSQNVAGPSSQLSVPFVPPLALTTLSSPAGDMSSGHSLVGAAGNVSLQTGAAMDTKEQNAGN